jgi:hypothetical protein
MLQLLALIALLQTPGGGTAERFLERDRTQGPTPVTGMFLIPPKIPDCRTQAEVDAALEAKRRGDFEKCDTERFLKPR